MSKYRHIFNIVLAMAAAFAAVLLFIYLLPLLIYILFVVVMAVIAWQIGSYAFAATLLAIRSR